MKRIIPFLCLVLVLIASGAVHAQYSDPDSETCDEAWLSHEWARAAVHCQSSGVKRMLSAFTDKLNASGSSDPATVNAAYVDAETAAARNAARAAFAYHQLSNHDHAMDSVQVALAAVKEALDGSPTDQQRAVLYHLSNFIKSGAIFRKAAMSSPLLN